jgi:putative SOS response-associated peptidase YedK
MCYRVDLDTASLDRIAKYLGVDAARRIEELRLGQQNAFAFPLLPVLASPGLHPELMSWGLVPPWVRDAEQAAGIRAKTLNARCETIFSLPSFRDAARSRRCVVLCTGFFEYRHEEDGRKVLYRVTRGDGEAMLLGGLWSTWQDRGSFSIVTMPANGLMSWVHNTRQRMPVVLGPDQLELWTDACGPADAGRLAPLFRPDDSLPLVADPVVPPPAAPAGA